MEKEPIRTRLSDVRGRFGRLVFQHLETFDDALDVHGDPELEDTQELDLSELFNEDHIVRGED